MENLIKAPEQYQAVANEDDINVNVELFNEFLKKISIWGYNCISREHYRKVVKHVRLH